MRSQTKRAEINSPLFARFLLTRNDWGVLDHETRVELARLVGAVRHPRPLLLAGTIAGRRRLQRHFAARDRTPNALGGRRTHFWREVRDSTQLGPVTDREGIIAFEIAKWRAAPGERGGRVSEPAGGEAPLHLGTRRQRGLAQDSRFPLAMAFEFRRG